MWAPRTYVCTAACYSVRLGTGQVGRASALRHTSRFCLICYLRTYYIRSTLLEASETYIRRCHRGVRVRALLGSYSTGVCLRKSRRRWRTAKVSEVTVVHPLFQSPHWFGIGCLPIWTGSQPTRNKAGWYKSAPKQQVALHVLFVCRCRVKYVAQRGDILLG